MVRSALARVKGGEAVRVRLPGLLERLRNLVQALAKRCKGFSVRDGRAATHTARGEASPGPSAQPLPLHQRPTQRGLLVACPPLLTCRTGPR
jgi:hypothetical protein